MEGLKSNHRETTTFKGKRRQDASDVDTPYVPVRSVLLVLHTPLQVRKTLAVLSRSRKVPLRLANSLQNGVQPVDPAPFGPSLMLH